MQTKSLIIYFAFTLLKLILTLPLLIISQYKLYCEAFVYQALFRFPHILLYNFEPTWSEVKSAQTKTPPLVPLILLYMVHMKSCMKSKWGKEAIKS